MKEPGGGNAEANGFRIESQPSVHQENQVEQQKGQAKLDQNFGWDVFTQLSVGVKGFRHTLKIVIL